jgi:hypothetical protein
VKTATDRFAEAIEAAEKIFPEILRTYILSAVVCVLLGIGIGFGWHYFVDRAGGRAAASAATPPAKQDRPNPPSPNPAAQRAGPVPDVAKGSGSSDAQQPARNMARDLSDEEKLTLVTLLTRNIAQDRPQSSARVCSLKQILFKRDPKPPVQPFSPPKVSAPPDAKRGSVRHREQHPNPSVPMADEIRAPPMTLGYPR